LSKIEIIIADVPDRERLVAEIWSERELMAELRWEADDQDCVIEIYPQRAGKPWSMPYKALVSALQQAMQRLKPTS
jgi:hypothetical protein